MRKIDEYIEEEKLGDDVRLLLQVHDELIYEIKEDKADKLAREFKRIMSEGISDELTGGVPIIAESKAGLNWGEMEK
jgi:DNA polymerase-1